MKANALKGKQNKDFKICANCGLEYNETNNFKWSCRTHQSEYNGEMWWCCGKNEQNAKGCRVASHFPQDDN